MAGVPKYSTTTKFHIDSRAAERKLGGYADKLGDISPALEKFGDFFREQMRLQFESEGDFLSHSPWKPLKVPRKGGKILDKTGAMRKSFTEKDAEHNINRVFKQTGEWGSSVDYARYHQEGTRFLPRRKIVDAEDSILGPQMVKLIAAHVFGEKREGE